MFEGVYTAIVTPFKEGKIDFEALEKLIEFNLEGGVSGIVPCGTTGETPTLSDEEYRQVIKFSVEKIGGRRQVIAGAGSNSTKKALENTKVVKDLGADAALVVTPYYNKPTQEGLKLHYREVAKADFPIVIYNVPGRTAVNMTAQTLIELANIEQIVGVKEASGDLVQMKEMRDGAREGLSILSGDDQLYYPFLALGGNGIISVTSNIAPKVFSSIYSMHKDGRSKDAEREFSKIFPLTCALFLETNPIPVKTALHMMGYIRDEFRLPLCKMKGENAQKLRKVLLECKLI